MSLTNTINKMEKVMANDLVKVTPTEKAKHMTKEKVVHRLVAEKLEAAGLVTIGDNVEAPTPSNKIGKKKKQGM